MENVQGKSTKRKRLSKNKKKSWRKVDITDVEDFLEDERLQERTGGKVSEKTDASLFFVEKKVKKGKAGLKSKQLRKKKAQEKLKEIEVTLKPPPAKRKDKRAPEVIKKEASGVLSATQKQAIQQRRKARHQKFQKSRTRHRYSVVNYDLWGDKLESELAGEDDHFVTVTKKKRVKAPERLKKPVSLVPAVEIPHPGSSYNPAADEYQELLDKAHSKEEKKLKEEKRLERALDDMFPSAKDAPNEKTRLEEMSAGLFHESDKEDDESNNDDEDLDKLSVNPPVRRENKKDEKRRKKEKALREKAQMAEKEKQKRIKENTFYRLRSIKTEISVRQKELEARAKQKAEKKARDLYRTKTLSKNKFQEPDLELKLQEELVGSLRELKPEGHLILDRFSSLMKRNILEVRGRPVPKKQRKYKPKVFEKKSHKDIQ